MMLCTTTMAILTALTAAAGRPRASSDDDASGQQLAALTDADVTHALHHARGEIDKAAASDKGRPFGPGTDLPMISEVMGRSPEPRLAVGNNSPGDSPRPREKPADRAKLYASLMAPLAKRHGPAAPLRAHGYYWFTENPNLAQIGNCVKSFRRLKDSYPTPAVMLNRPLLADSQTCSMLMSVLDGDILAWAAVSEEAGSLELLAGFLKKYGHRISVVVVGDAPSVSRADGGRGRPRLMVRPRTYDLWLGFVKYALPGRTALLVLPAGGDSGAAHRGVLSAVGRKGADGIFIWNHPDLRQGHLGKPEKLTADLDRRIGRRAVYVAGDWAAAEREAFQTTRVYQCEKAIEKSLAGYVRCVGLIPDRCRAIHTAYGDTDRQPLTLRTRR